MISYLEDNELGIYKKEILVEANSFLECVHEYTEKFPTLFGAKEIFGPICEDWRNFYTHESQDAIQRAKKEMKLELV